METMMTLTEAARAGRKSKGERRADGTAVFVGRASFRMTPTPTYDSTEASHFGEMTLTPPAEWFQPVEESVILSAPESARRDDLLQTARLPRIVGPFPGHRARRRRRRTPSWMIGVALVAGATVTLSAQVVLRAPTTHDAAGTVGTIGTVATVGTVGTVGTVATLGTVGVVVPSTPNVPAVRMPEQPAARLTKGAGRSQGAHAGAASPRPRASGVPSRAAPASSSFTRAKFTKVSATVTKPKTAAGAWVDPFAD